MRIGIYPGSFNPVHKGHIRIVRHLLKKDYADQILIVATGNYWQKQDLLPVKDRIRMLKYFETEKIRIEEECNELPYTYQLMRQLKKRYPEDTLSLIIGADMAETLSRWKRYRELLKYDFIILKRDGIDIDRCMESLQKKNYTVVDDLEEIHISSTYIRENIDDYRKLKDQIDYRVYRYYRKAIH
ncbi:MAG: nicotinate-nicotinamide nucleotide adenylyltransferase [Erysipelotrichaceae bacterium]|nr:nicotinate-nicotinamide nucleotide adenylyltransferase [Erysipelotrichaceae bacterium]